MKIVYIDDDKFLSDLYNFKFKEAGYDVRTFNTVNKDVIQQIADFNPDLVSLDITMPDPFQLDRFTF